MDLNLVNTKSYVIRDIRYSRLTHCAVVVAVLDIGWCLGDLNKEYYIEIKVIVNSLSLRSTETSGDEESYSPTNATVRSSTTKIFNF